ncbi:Hypothetical_protein [Hexamita inflata]|uniref:Hypothetical_protein n=1 Tax=Hexamita inflata TaxID=28002 RepID=A0AA86R236_9EUKA|nr:Hypothetical protein HINF_LOCUS56540 [Hexamita inflata]
MLGFGIVCLLSDLLVVMLLFGFFEFTHHCRRCIKLTLQFSLQFGDLFERLNFLVIAFRVTLVWVGLSGFFFVDVSSSLSLPFSAVCVDIFLVFVLWAFSKFFCLGFAGTSLIGDCVATFIIYLTIIYISHFLETAQTDFIETFKSKTKTLARQCFHFQNGLNPSFTPTQQRPDRVLTESSADQFYLIRQLIQLQYIYIQNVHNTPFRRLFYSVRCSWQLIRTSRLLNSKFLLFWKMKIKKYKTQLSLGIKLKVDQVLLTYLEMAI